MKSVTKNTEWAAILPASRKNDLVVQTLGSEMLVYDVSSHKAYSLNEAMSYIWEHCDGKTTLGELRLKFGKRFKTVVDSDFFLLALEEFSAMSLVEQSGIVVKDLPLSRRNVLLKYALPTFLMPAILSISAPKAVSAQSVNCSQYLDQTSCPTPVCMWLVDMCVPEP